MDFIETQIDSAATQMDVLSSQASEQPALLDSLPARSQAQVSATHTRMCPFVHAHTHAQTHTRTNLLSS